MAVDGKIKISFMPANPLDGSSVPLRVDQEFRDIQEQIRMSKHREKFQLEIRPAAHPGNISQAILEVEPNIIHLSGHGLTLANCALRAWMDPPSQLIQRP